MKRSLVFPAVGPAIVLVASAALAAPFDAYGSRSTALEAAGTAAGQSATGFFGRARLGTTSDDGGFTLDSILEDSFLAPVGVRGNLDAFEDHPKIPARGDFRLSISDFGRKQGHPGIFSRKRGTDLGDHPAEYGSLSKAPRPGPASGFSVSGNAWAALSRIGGNRDQHSSTGLPTAAGCCVADPTVARTTLLANSRYVDATGTGYGPDANIDSSAEVRGVYVTEVGLGLSHEFGNGGGAYVLGLTPKYVIADVVDYQTDSSSIADPTAVNLDNAETYRHFNADLRIARDFGNGWRTGLVLQNVFAREYETGQNKAIKLTPQARIDVIHELDW